MAQRSVSFDIALAPEWEQTDLLTPAGERRIRGTLAAVLARTARDHDPPGLHPEPSHRQARPLMARSLIAHAESGEPLAASLWVTLAVRAVAISSTALMDGVVGDADICAIGLPAGDGVRMYEVVMHRTSGGSEIPVLRVRYELATAFGLLVISLACFHTERAAVWERLFDAMAQTAQLA
jgi:hypothetical protein